MAAGSPFGRGDEMTGGPREIKDVGCGICDVGIFRHISSRDAYCLTSHISHRRSIGAVGLLDNTSLLAFNQYEDRLSGLAEFFAGWGELDFLAKVR